MTTPRLQVNIPAENHGQCPFVNWMHHKQPTGGFAWVTVDGSPVTEVSAANLYTSGYVNAKGELIDITNVMMFAVYLSLEQNTTGLTGNQKSGTKQMKATWTGDTVTGVVGNISNIVESANSATFTLDLGVNAWVGFLIDETQGDGQPPSMPVIYEVAKEADVGVYHMDRDTIDFIGRFASIRPLFAMGTNGSEAEDFADLATVDDVFWGGTSRTYPSRVGWPLEAVMEIPNRTGRIYWDNIPIKSTDAAVTARANAFRDGINWTANELRLLVEFSNESPWNYDQTYCNTQAGLEANVSTGPAWYGYQATRFFGLYQTSFGTNSGSKWAGVLGAQLTNTYMAEQAIIGARTAINPSNPGGVTNEQLAERVTYLAVTNYLGVYPTSISSGVGATLAAWLAEGGQEMLNQRLYEAQREVTTPANIAGGEIGNVANIRAYWANHKTVADAAGLQMIAYEGGGHNVCGNPLRDSENTINTALALYQRSEQFADILLRLFNYFVLDTGGIPSVFDLYGVKTKYWSAQPYETFSDMNPVNNAVEAWNKGIDAPDPKRRYMTVNLTAS